jgi:heavy metal sensor kinase
MTLRARLALVNVAVLLIALLLLAAIVLNQVVNDLYEKLDQDLETTSRRELAQVVIVNNTPLFISSSNQSQPQLGPIGFIRLLDSQGYITDGLGDYTDAPVLRRSLVTTPHGSVFNQTNGKGLPLRVHTLPIIAGNRVVGYIQVADSGEEVQETINRVRRSLIVGTPLALLVSGLISLLAARQAMRPLTTMTRSAAAISAEALGEQRLPVPKAKDEVQALALAFNATLDRLAAAFARQRRFTADASHELRTPVTAILGHAELALNRPRSREAYQHTLTLIQSEAERMQRLIGRMLTLARLDAGRQALSFAPTDVSYLIHTLVDTLQPTAAAKGLTLNFSGPAALTIQTDADSLTQVLLNLLKNAMAYTDEGSIDLTLSAASDHVCMKISDTGQGIPPEHLPYIFQPFYRADASRSQKDGSVGLGLALTHELVHLLGGSIEVTSQPQVGTTFTLTLPTNTN